ncbi:RNA polymerase sigma-70 factor [Arcticibacter tournemirensis]|uniref:RNA polymerase sigma-70 factor n=1 Tax=Arcticibacter tournemirensis TaxID=699437 RepID=A0A4Q0M2H6_9SPHI|nr:RNA polymerase sigma-70 factor [Arcticibacter tournemirensis]RXF66965.1 RNA polymerase sigma-70 factor [Arcticibacter tournemirensis]
MSLKQVSDHLLLEKCGQNDINAYEVLFERYFRRLYTFTLHYVKDKSVAEELVMDLMLMLWKRRNDLELQGELLPYLFKAMRNSVISYARKRAVATISLESINDKHPAGERSADYNLYASEIEDLYRQKLRKLSPQRRQVFEMSRIENKTYPEIARQLNLSPNTVRNHMSASLQYFREHLGKYVDATLMVLIFQYLTY